MSSANFDSFVVWCPNDPEGVHDGSFHPVLALRDSDGWGGKIVGIAPLPTERGETFIFDDLRVKHFAEPVA